MDAERWRHFYESELQSLWSLVALPALFLLYAATRGRAQARRVGGAEARFVLAWSLAFALETVLDPVATGPLTRALALEGLAAQALMLVFVLLGDFRVLWLAFALALGPGRAARAAALAAGATLVVPLLAYAGDAALRTRAPELPGQVLWLVYELAFLAFALLLRARALPRLAGGSAATSAARLRVPRALLAYAAVYYALWALADAMILAGVDAGWLLRVLPNQLYYAWFVPFAFTLYFGARRARASAAAT